MTNEKCTFNVEVTDTFGGEANYSWVKRYTFDMDVEATPRRVMQKAKKLAGFTGVRGRTETHNLDSMSFTPHKNCVVLFVNADY